MALLTVHEKVRLKQSRRQHKENESDCRLLVQQLVSSIPQNVEMRTSYKKKQHEIGTQKSSHFRGAQSRTDRSRVEKFGARRFTWESGTEGCGLEDGQFQVDKVLSGEFRWMSRSYPSESTKETCSTVDSSVDLGEIEG